MSLEDNLHTKSPSEITVAVAGATGYIGKAVVRELVSILLCCHVRSPIHAVHHASKGGVP
jgi:uncharacterized protein YbjT (DUF2867 family)